MCRVYQNTKDTSTQNGSHDAHTLAMFSLAAVLIRFFIDYVVMVIVR